MEKLEKLVSTMVQLGKVKYMMAIGEGTLVRKL